MSTEAKILPYEELIRIYREHLKPCPYVVSVVADNQSATFVAVKHTNDLKDSQITIIRNAWKEFQDNTLTSKRIILSEGGVSPLEKDEVAAIEKYGEPGLLRFWADKSDIEIDSPEPSRKYEADELLKKFSKAEVMHYYFTRQVPQWHRERHGSSAGFEEYMQYILAKYAKVLGWDFDFSLENLIEIHESITGEEFDYEDGQFLFDLSNPTQDSYITQKVARASSNLRDQHFADSITKYWEEGYSIFGVFGSAHVYRLEPVIKGLATNESSV